MTKVQDSAVGIVTGCGLDGTGMESYWGRDFTHPSRLALVSSQPPVQWQTGLCSGGKAAGLGVDHAPPYSPKVKESVQLNLYSTSGPS